MNCRLVSAIVTLLLLLFSLPAGAAPVQRTQVIQNGDFILIGNTLAQDCDASVPAPIVGAVGMCGMNTADTSPDVYWIADNPANGQASATLANLPAQARTTAVLNLPVGAVVTKAFLYWGARNTPNALADTTVTLNRTGGFTANVTALSSLVSNGLGVNNFYQSVADVTSLVQANGSGGYSVSGVDALDFSDDNVGVVAVGWWMVVLYQRVADPLRQLTVFDGLDPVAIGTSVPWAISGFTVPNSGINGKAGFIAFDGDAANTGDSVTWNGTALTDAIRPANAFFNSSKSVLGAAFSPMGDLPQLTGAPNSMSGFDIGVVDVSSNLVAGATSANVSATTTSDTYFINFLAASISTNPPVGTANLSTSSKSVLDLNGGSIASGDVLEYTITVINTGSTFASNLIVIDMIPAGTTYVPGSLKIATGPNPGNFTDAPGDDQGELVGNTVVVRAGAAANAINGGTLNQGQSTTVVFRVTVGLGTTTISNQASLLTSSVNFLTDNDAATPGAQPIVVVVVDQCTSDAQCAAPTPHCKSSASPHVCVQCLLDAQCPSPDQCHLVPVCDAALGVCSNPAKANDSLCDDGDACTIGDSCQLGVCASGTPMGCLALDDCHDPGTCDPTTGTCTDPAKSDGTPCSIGSCQAGVCEPPANPDAGTDAGTGGFGGGSTGSTGSMGSTGSTGSTGTAGSGGNGAASSSMAAGSGGTPGATMDLSCHFAMDRSRMPLAGHSWILMMTLAALLRRVTRATKHRPLGYLSKGNIAFLSIFAVLVLSSSASASPTLRMQINQKGDFVLLGNTLGHECDVGTPAPVAGTVGNCGTNTSDSAPDIFWRADSPAMGQAEANNSITIAQARSTAVLNIPVGAVITHAYLYWGATLPMLGMDTQVTLDRPGVFTQAVTAIQSYQSANNTYQSVADVTAIVQANGPGAYRVSDVDASPIVDVNSSNNFAGWWMAVFYQLATDPPRNLALFDGLDVVSNGNNQNVTISGFLVPNAGFSGKLGVITFEGDNSINGDQLFFNGGAALSNALNPADNFFNGTRSLLGAAVSNAGDLPRLTGTAQSMSGIDLDVVDVTNKLSAGQTSAPIQATSTGDVYFLAGFVTSISTFKPDFSTSTKTAVDVNGGALVAGDTLQYTISVTNTGNDTSLGTVLTDPLPAGVTFVPGSLQIVSGPNAGAKSDSAGNDQAEYVSGTSTVVFRLGTGANGAVGGTLLPNQTTVVSFQVTVNPGVTGTISNQATINASGLLGGLPEDTPTDGNGAGGGAPPTIIVVEVCSTSNDCPQSKPYCDTVSAPNVCVECLIDAQCDDGNACTLVDTCQAGECTPGAPTICSPLDDCHESGTCDSITGACSNPEKPDGSECLLGFCKAGVCESQPDAGSDGGASGSSATSGSSGSSSVTVGSGGGSSMAAGSGGAPGATMDLRCTSVASADRSCSLLFVFVMIFAALRWRRSKPQ